MQSFSAAGDTVALRSLALRPSRRRGGHARHTSPSLGEPQPSAAAPAARAPRALGAARTRRRGAALRCAAVLLDAPAPAASPASQPSVVCTDDDVLIQLVDVCKAFGSKKVLSGVSLTVRRGEAVGIIGPSGTGKSTVLKLMAGLVAPDSGQVYIRGRPRSGLASDEEKERLRVGMVFQSAALFDSLTVGENVGFTLYEHSDLSEAKIKALVAASLQKVGLSGVEGRMPSMLSGGMRKRVALARAIIADPSQAAGVEEVLMYDEPTAGLDPIASTVIEDLMRDLAASAGGVTSYIVVTHQHSTIRRAVDRLLFLHDGHVAWSGSAAEFDSSDNPLVHQFATGSRVGPLTY